MKVFGIAGSPRKGGNTELLTAQALRAVSEESVEAELIRVGGVDIRPLQRLHGLQGRERLLR